MIEIFPAIDLHNGQAVRLRQGDYNQVEVFFKNPVEVLEFFNKNESKNLHIVDLDGARDGLAKNYSVIKELVEKSDFFVQVGGGIRDEERIKKYIDLGVNRVILGTVAVENEQFLKEMVKKYGDKIDKSDIKNETNGAIVSDKSAISGGSVSTTEIKKVSSKIEEFVGYCNEHDVEKAYAMNIFKSESSSFFTSESTTIQQMKQRSYLK